MAGRKERRKQPRLWELSSSKNVKENSRAQHSLARKYPHGLFTRYDGLVFQAIGLCKMRFAITHTYSNRVICISASRKMFFPFTSATQGNPCVSCLCKMAGNMAKLGGFPNKCLELPAPTVKK